MTKDMYVESDDLLWRVGTNGVPLESPNGRDWIVWRPDETGPFRAETPSRALRRYQHHLNEMVRIGPKYPQRPNQHSWYFSAATGKHVWCESVEEESCLIELEFSAAIVGLASQPFRMLFRNESTEVRHDADFFVLLRDGGQWVLNVKPRAKLAEPAVQAQLLETERICELVGWRHVVMHRPEDDRLWNLRMIHSARLWRFHPERAMLRSILNAFEGGQTIRAGRTRVDRHSPALVMPFILHLLWHRLLDTDLSEVIDFDTVLTAKIGPDIESSCCA